MRSDERLRVGVAGCGRIARALHIPGYQRSPRANLVAFFNHRRDTADDLLDIHPGTTLYDDFDRFLGESGVEAISVCTPNVMHAEMTIAALRRGVHVLVEKPMATSTSDAREMINAAADSTAILTIGHSERYYPAHREARRIIESGALGRVFQVRMMEGHRGPLNWSPRGDWFLTPGLAGSGVIGDLGVHKTDLLRYLTGEEVVDVFGFATSVEITDLEDNAAAVMTLSGGGIATLAVSWTLRGGNIDDIVLIGEGGSIRVHNAGLGSPVVVYLASGDRIEHDVEAGIPLSAEREWLLDEVPEFVLAAMGEAPNPITGEDGYRALEICAAIDRSARTGEIVHLPLDSGEGALSEDAAHERSTS